MVQKTLESPLDSKEIEPAYHKRNQPLIFIGRTNPEAPTVRQPGAKSPLIGKDSDAGKKIDSKDRKGLQRIRWLDSITNSMALNFNKLHQIVEDRGV